MIGIAKRRTPPPLVFIIRRAQEALGFFFPKAGTAVELAQRRKGEGL